ncbi:protein CcmA, bactofilin family [Treponema berlinense]|uniref:Protein CcmA, bactofilin family n=1 Tax=Treponema berlinense TaxID=225004 RepID=A0A1T4PYR6_9SPIR|nr:polymer-forming cytoskeletal protein [Treponema berlinense]SJZ96653.1 protein CcmA, bactofilin family [Treponema berlinense]
MAFTSDDISINTLIGPGSFVSGDIKINGFIRIDGDIKGKIESSSNIIIGERAKIQGNITASSIVVGGIVLGDITAPKGIKLLSTSVVIGDIITKSIQIEDDAIFNGHCISLSIEEEFKASSRQYLDQQAIRSKVI